MLPAKYDYNNYSSIYQFAVFLCFFPLLLIAHRPIDCNAILSYPAQLRMEIASVFILKEIFPQDNRIIKSN